MGCRDRPAELTHVERSTSVIVCYVEPTVKRRSMVSAQGCGHVETTLVGRSRSVLGAVDVSADDSEPQAILLAVAGCSAWS
jgi:hypothetical protein